MHVLISQQRVKLFILTRVLNVVDIGTLFRSNSMASRIMSAYGRNIGMEYMKQYLKPLIDKIIAQNEYLEVLYMRVFSSQCCIILYTNFCIRICNRWIR